MKNTGKKLLCIALALVMALGMMTCAFAADTGAKAVVSAQTLYVNGANSTCEKYNIDGYNYFKLRDLAALLSGTDYQFEVAVNGDARIVEITTGKAYTTVGGELTVGEDKSATCVESAWKLTVDGKAVDAKAYNLGGNNYFKLRDLGEAIGFAVDYDAVNNASVVTAQKGVAYIHVNDGKTKLTDELFNKYFNGDAKAGVEALLAAGKVSINGIPLPKTEDELTVYNINKFQALYKGEKGWGYEVHKTKTDTNMSFADARLGLINMVSTVCGHTTKLYLGADGKVEKIDASNVESVFVTDIISHGVTTEIKRGDFQLETNRGARPDVNDIAFAINDEVEIGDMVYYYYGADGWVCFKAPSVTGTIEHSDSIAGGKGYVINGTDARRESNVSRYNLRTYNRPTQFWEAYDALGLNEIAVNVWCTATGNPIGFSYGTNGKTAMKKAVETCKALMEGVVISEDGEGLAAGTRWIAQEYMTEFQTALAAAEKYSKSNAIGVCEWDQYIYELAAALGTDNAKKPSGFLGNIGIA